LDLYTANGNANFSLPSKDYHVVPPNVSRLMKDRSAFRYFIAPGTANQTILDENSEFYDYRRALSLKRDRLVYDQNMLFGLAAIDGYESIKGADQERLIKKIVSLDSLNGVRILDLVNVKYLVSAWPFQQRGYKLLALNRGPAKQTTFLYENTNVLPRAFFVPKSAFMPDRNEILDRISQPGFQPRSAVILEEPVDSPGGFWFTSEWFYPGWRAYVDGREAKIYRANFMFRAVPVPKGFREVKFVYEPLSFKLGAVISLVTLFGLIMAFSIIFAYNKYK
ncbi:MAG: YfhO family protein, partial [Candidatus Margulisbacteria bacterium]|nr:YfhO family protein [Candidatus Margulisiibacteriota bacterium]